MWGSGAPKVQVLQSGASAPVVVPMTYEGSSGAYVGTLTLDTDLPPSGDIEVSATDTAARTVQAAAASALRTSPACKSTVGMTGRGSGCL